MKILHEELARAFGFPYTVVPCVFEDMDHRGWSDELKTVNLWCWEAFGKQGETYDHRGVPHRWYQQNGHFWFRDEADMAWFKLRWQ